MRGINAQAQTINVTSREADILTTRVKLQATDITLDAAKNPKNLDYVNWI
ncbi:MAG: hypothetical protein QM749_15345 [Aquabacterium sp.]